MFFVVLVVAAMLVNHGELGTVAMSGSCCPGFEFVNRVLNWMLSRENSSLRGALCSSLLSYSGLYCCASGGGHQAQATTLCP